MVPVWKCGMLQLDKKSPHPGRIAQALLVPFDRSLFVLVATCSTKYNKIAFVKMNIFLKHSLKNA